MGQVTLFEMWGVVISYALSVNAVLYLLVGLIASILHAKKIVLVVLFTIASGILGVFLTFFLAAVPSLLLAGLYKSVDSSMSAIEAVILGCSQGVVIALLNAGVFHRLL